MISCSLLSVVKSDEFTYIPTNLILAVLFSEALSQFKRSVHHSCDSFTVP